MTPSRSPERENIYKVWSSSTSKTKSCSGFDDQVHCATNRKKSTDPSIGIPLQPSNSLSTCQICGKSGHNELNYYHQMDFACEGHPVPCNTTSSKPIPPNHHLKHGTANPIRIGDHKALIFVQNLQLHWIILNPCSKALKLFNGFKMHYCYHEFNPMAAQFHSDSGQKMEQKVPQVGHTRQVARPLSMWPS